MARAKKTPSKPAPQRARPPGRAAAAAPPPKPVEPTETREDMIAEMNKLLDDVDAQMPIQGGYTWAFYTHGLRAENERSSDLTTRMWKLIGHNSDENVSDIFREACATPHDKEPGFARSGRFVEWLGWVPLLVEWEGFIGKGCSVRLLDPANLWVSQTGYKSVHVQLPAGCPSPRAWFRLALQQLSLEKNFALVEVEAASRERAAERLESDPWLREQLDRGPVNPVPLPKHLQAVQAGLGF